MPKSYQSRDIAAKIDKARAKRWKGRQFSRISLDQTDDMIEADLRSAAAGGGNHPWGAFA